MIELSPSYFYSKDKDHSLEIGYYPINNKWRLLLENKGITTEYWIDFEQAKNLRDVFDEPIRTIENKQKQAIVEP